MNFLHYLKKIMNKLSLLFTLTSIAFLISSCGPSICDCLKVDKEYGMNPIVGTKGWYKVDDCRDKYDGFNNIRRRSDECK